MGREGVIVIINKKNKSFLNSKILLLRLILWSVSSFRDWNASTAQSLNASLTNLFWKKIIGERKEVILILALDEEPTNSAWIKCIPFTIPNSFINLQMFIIKQCCLQISTPLVRAEVSHKGTNLKIDPGEWEDGSLPALSAPLANSEWKTQVMSPHM